MSEPNEEFVELAIDVGLPLSRLVSLSKSGFIRRHPQHAVIFNATIANASGERLWWGDVDRRTTRRPSTSWRNARGSTSSSTTKATRAGGFVKTINPANAVVVFRSDDTLTIGTRSPLVRTPFGRIIWQRSEPADIPAITEE